MRSETNFVRHQHSLSRRCLHILEIRSLSTAWRMKQALTNILMPSLFFTNSRGGHSEISRRTTRSFSRRGLGSARPTSTRTTTWMGSAGHSRGGLKRSLHQGATGCVIELSFRKMIAGTELSGMFHLMSTDGKTCHSTSMCDDMSLGSMCERVCAWRWMEKGLKRWSGGGRQM